MRYLSGTTAGIAHELATGDIGLMRTPRNGYTLDDIAVWAMDNGCFTDGYPGDDAYLDLLAELAPHADRCMFATAPDIVGDAAGTLERSAPMLERIRALGYPVALVAQDGLENLTVPWSTFDCLFVGGSTLWKLSTAAADLILEAHHKGKAVHIGRVNSRRRWDRFAELGPGVVTSCDGTLLAFGPDKNLRRLRTWIDNPSRQIQLDLA